MANPNIFESNDAAKLCPVSYRTKTKSLYGHKTCGPSFSRVNPNTIGCVLTGEFNLNTLGVAGMIFESGEKKSRIQKYLDTCGRRGPELCNGIVTVAMESRNGAIY